MKKQLLLCLFIFNSTFLLAQLNLTDFNNQRIQNSKKAMTVLGTWAVGNILVGGIGMTQTEGQTKAFHQMNAGWGAINLVIAGFGYYNAMQTDPASLTLANSITEHHKIQKVLLFNAGLDIGYMLGGLYLTERAKNSPDKADQFRGFGKSIIMQGAFLFVFDVSVM